MKKSINFTVFAFCGGCQNRFTSILEGLAEKYADDVYEIVSTPTSASGDYTYKIEIEEKDYNNFIDELTKAFSKNSGWKFAEKNPTLLPANAVKSANDIANTGSEPGTLPAPTPGNCSIQ